MKLFYATKWVTFMRISFLYNLLIFSVSTFALANKNYAQLLDKTISINLSNASFEESIDALESAADVKFAYSPHHFINEPSFTIQIENKSLRVVLEEIWSLRNIKYIVHEADKTITLKKLKATTQQQGPPKEARHSPVQPTTTVVLHGVVTDSKTGLPMPGVNIIVKGTSIGTTTDANGAYSLEVSPGDKLVFSFIGFTSQEFAIDGQTELNVFLAEEASKLEEVIVNAGYYQTTKVNQTGNINKIIASDIQKQPVSNPIAALQGRVPGLQIIQETGVPGGNFQIRIRGQNSITNGNDPLILIDGIPYMNTSMSMAETSKQILFNGTSPLNSINPADIESIEVLKDADATAIYGSRGANGVILITTKKGQPGKLKLDMNFYSGAGKVTNHMNLLTSSQYNEMRREALQNDGFWPLPPSLHSFVPDVFVWDTTRYTDWQKELLGGTANTTDAQFSLSGGDRLINFSWSAGYHREGTVFPGNNSDQRLYTNLNLNTKSANERLSTSLSMKYVLNSSNLFKQDLTTTALTLPPIAPPVYNLEGGLNWDNDAWNQNFPNPLAYTLMDYNATTNNILMNLLSSYKIVDNLEAKINMGFSNVSMDAITTTPRSALPPASALFTENESVFSNTNFSNWTIEPQLNWKPKIANGQFDMLVGTTFLEQIQDGLSQYAYGFADESLMKNLGASSSRTLASNYYNQYRYHAVFARINYALNDKYIFNLTGRRDGSSRFGPGKQFANFGAVGAAWIFSNENILKNNSLLSFGKLRASVGLTGNDQIGDYQYLDTYTPSGTYHGTATLTPARLANADFAWETNKKIEAAIELGFFENNILISTSAYRNRSSNQLVGLTLPPTAGFTSLQANLPAVVENSGIEIELSSTNITRKNVTWTTSINFSLPHNELIEFPNLQASPAYANRFAVGEPLTILKRYQYLQVDQATGLYQFKDVNNDDLISTPDRQTIVFVGQKFFGGLQSSLQWKQFQFDFLFQFVNQQRPNYLSAFGSAPGNPINQPDWVTTRWTVDNSFTDIQKYSFLSAGNITYNQLTASDRSISDASFIRLKNIYLSYSLPSQWCSKNSINQLKIFLQGQNLLTFTNYDGLDPETGSNFLPPLRILSAGFNLTL